MAVEGIQVEILTTLLRSGPTTCEEYEKAVAELAKQVNSVLERRTREDERSPSVEWLQSTSALPNAGVCTQLTAVITYKKMIDELVA